MSLKSHIWHFFHTTDSNRRLPTLERSEYERQMRMPLCAVWFPDGLQAYCRLTTNREPPCWEIPCGAPTYLKAVETTNTRWMRL